MLSPKFGTFRLDLGKQFFLFKKNKKQKTNLTISQSHNLHFNFRHTGNRQKKQK